MRAIDTNVAARYLLADDPRQYEIAKTIIAGGVFLPTTVLLELGWLLGSRYGFGRDVIVRALAELIDLPTTTVEDVASLRWALDRYAAGADLADMVHLAGSRHTEAFATFDRSVAPGADESSPLPVETLR